MLNKGVIYSGYSKPYKGENQQPSGNFQEVKILFEDDISYYVESSTRKDAIGNGIRYSVKKHCFELIPFGRKETKMTEKQILEKSITNHQLAIDAAKSALADLEVTYLIGDRFYGPNGKYILVSAAYGKVLMCNLTDGNRWADPKEFDNVSKIPQAKFTEAYGSIFVRYWDIKKQELRK